MFNDNYINVNYKPCLNCEIQYLQKVEKSQNCEIKYPGNVDFYQ